VKTISVLLPGLGLELCYAAIRRTEANAIGETVSLLIAASLFYIVACFKGFSHDPRIVLGFALLHRLTVWPLMPQLSDDVYRYRWEARVQIAGGNPYLSRPSDTNWSSLLDVPPGRIPAPDAPAGYGPLQTLVQRAVGELFWQDSQSPEQQARWMKLPSALGDLAVLAMLARQQWLVVYAWAPATVVEIAWNGHNDGLVLAFAVAAWRWRSFAALGFAASLKWWPVLLVPALIAAERKNRAALRVLSIPLILAVTAVPFLPPDWRDLTGAARYMSGYVGGWRNNDSLFGVTLWLAGGREYLAKYLTFAALCVVTLWMAWRWPLAQAWLGTVAATLLLSANCHPWYVTWMLPAMAAIGPWPPILLWIGLMPLAYGHLVSWRVLGEWQGSTPERWWIFGPVLAMMALYTGKFLWTRGRSS
jgi:hypothetical protein